LSLRLDKMNNRDVYQDPLVSRYTDKEMQNIFSDNFKSKPLPCRKSEVYCGFYRRRGDRLEKVTDPMVLPPVKLCSMVEQPTLFFGEGIRVYSSLLKRELGEKACFLEEDGLETVAAAAARIGWQSLPACVQRTGRSGAVEAPSPKLELLYVRPSEAEFKRQSGGEERRA